MFSKADRKLKEVQFFRAHMASKGLGSEAICYFLSALLGAAYSMLQALEAEWPTKISGKDTLQDWKATLGAPERDEFEVLSHLRDADVHTIQPLSLTASESPMLVYRMVQSGANTPIMAQVLAQGGYLAEVVEQQTVYAIDLEKPRKREAKELFARVSASGTLRLFPVIDDYIVRLQQARAYFLSMRLQQNARKGTSST